MPVDAYFPAAAPYLRKQIATEAYMATAVKSVPARKEALAKVHAYQHALTILLNSPEGASSEYGVAEPWSLPSGALDAARKIVGERTWAASGWEEPAGEEPQVAATQDVEPEDAPAEDAVADVNDPTTFADEPVETPKQSAAVVDGNLLASGGQGLHPALVDPAQLDPTQSPPDYQRALAKARGTGK